MAKTKKILGKTVVAPGALEADAVPKPGYRTTKPLYPAVADLFVMLGTQDARVNLNEVALRFFERIAGTQESSIDFINSTCRHMGVSTRLGVPWAEARRNGHQFAIVQTMSVVEAFLDRLSREYREYRKMDPVKWKFKKDGEDLDGLNALAENLPADKRKAVREYPEFGLIDYYRLVRNRVVHQSARDTDAALKKLLEKHRSHFHDNYGAVPSSYAKIAYSDFMLFTRATKYFSRILNEVCDLSPALVFQFHVEHSEPAILVAGTAGPTDKSTPWLPHFRKMKGSPKRVPGFAAKFKKIYRMSDTDESRFEEKLREFLITDAPRKVRRKAAQK